MAPSVSFLNILIAFSSLVHGSVALIAIIGGTGVIGSKIIESFEKYPRLASYREGRKHLIPGLNMAALGKRKEEIGSFKLDLNNIDWTQVLSMPLWNLENPEREDVLINCAGVCISGSSTETMLSSLQVNAVGPICLTMAALQVRKRLTIINVSSGEGERAMLNSAIVTELDRLSSSKELDVYIEYLYHTYNPSFEYAYGPTPMYSLSKAILNKSTQLLHDEYRRDSDIRILACCPGNVASPMSTQEELEDIVSAEYAAHQIFKLVTEPANYPGGRFYRHGEQIPW